MDRHLTDEQFQLLSSSPLLVVRKVADITLFTPTTFTSTSSEMLFECQNNDQVEVMLKEVAHYLRPVGHYLGQIEYNHTMTVQLKLTKYGKPVSNEIVHVFPDSATESDSIPSGGVQTETTATTDEDGLASFIFRVVEKILPPRKFSTNITCPNHQPPDITEAPIEGQIYFFNYNTSATPNTSTQFQQLLTPINRIAIVGFSYFEAPEKPNWIEHVQLIFKQYEHLYPVMKDFIHLGNYTQVTLTHNLNMIRFAMSRDINHPNYMPVTRDLSPTKRNMILKWLKQKPKPMYDGSMEKKMQDSDMYPRCNICHGAEEIQEQYYTNLYQRVMKHTKSNFFIRPLFKLGVQKTSLRSMGEICTVKKLKQQLQHAIELEFSTIPPYITTLYSIVSGENEEIHKRIRSILIQEMQHLTQAANILIAIGGKPQIDGKEHAPTYPGNLPGGVLPNLVVTLEKLSTEYVSKVLMGIEVPHNTSLDSDHPLIFNDTIGQFYKEIEVCFHYLNEHGNIFFKPENEKHQIKWPWDAPTVGKVQIVTNHKTAIKAIHNIVEQEEGATPLDPSQGSSVTKPPFLSHFYNFEEIVCHKSLILNDHDKFCFNGNPIPFNQSGVWPMQPNPGKKNIPLDTKCYTAARSFHNAYRALLRKLQDVFDGHPDDLKDVIAMMYTLAAHGHKVMTTKLNDNSEETCGPVWDYEWDESYMGIAEDTKVAY